MSRMAIDFFAASPVLVFPLIALALFLFVFVGVCVAVYRLPEREVSRRARLPLHSEESRE